MNGIDCSFVFVVLQAILQQWEADNRRGGGSQYLVLNGGSNWATNGYAVVSSMTADENRPRVKGCLKHVSHWLSMVKLIICYHC